MDFNINLIVDGICTGARYAILGMGFALIFNSQRMFDLSFGGIYTWTGFVLWISAVKMSLSIETAFLLAFIFCFSISYLIQKSYVGQLRKRSGKAVSIMLGSMAIMMIMEAVAAIIWGGEIRLGRVGNASIYKWGEIQISDIKFYTVMLSAAIFIIFRFIFMKTPLGVKSRAIASNSFLSRVIGLDTEKTIILTTCFGCTVIGVDAALVCADTGTYPSIGFQSMLIAFMAVILGGIGSFEGAFIGGLLIGFIRTVAAANFPTLWQEMVLFVILFLIIAFRPNGLLGIKDWKSEV